MKRLLTSLSYSAAAQDRKPTSLHLPTLQLRSPLPRRHNRLEQSPRRHLPASQFVRTYICPSRSHLADQDPDHPSQHELTDLVENKTTAEEYTAMAAEIRKRGCEALDPLFEQVDIVVTFADSPLCMYTSASGQSLRFPLAHRCICEALTSAAHARNGNNTPRPRLLTLIHADAAVPGYPIACVPLSTVKYSEQNERPFGLCLAAGAGQEELLLRFMHAYERASPPRPLPKPLLAS